MAGQDDRPAGWRSNSHETRDSIRAAAGASDGNLRQPRAAAAGPGAAADGVAYARHRRLQRQGAGQTSSQSSGKVCLTCWLASGRNASDSSGRFNGCWLTPAVQSLIEATWGELERGGWRSKVTPAAAMGSVLGWIAAGVPVLMAGNHERAGRYVSRLLFTAARRRWREARRSSCRS